MTRSGLKRGGGGGAGAAGGGGAAEAEEASKRAKTEAPEDAGRQEEEETATAAASSEVPPTGQLKVGDGDEEQQDVAVAEAVEVTDAAEATKEEEGDILQQQQQPASSSAALSASHALPTKANKARAHGGGSSLRSQAYQQQQQFNADQMLANFDHYLFQLLAFKVETGNFHVPKDHDLHTWLQFLKREFKNHCSNKASSSLTEDQIKVLEFLHVPLTSRGEEHWNRFYELLRQYQERHGHVLVPRLCEIPGLGDWVTDQRRQYKSWKQGQQSQLTQERREKLEQLGFAWQVRNRPEWDMRFQQLLEYRDKHGDCKVPQHYKDNKALGKWTAKQREQYKLYKKGQHSFLTPYRLEKLNQIGFVWQVRSQNDGEDELLDDGKEAVHDEAVPLKGEEGDAAAAAAAVVAAVAMKDPPAAVGQKSEHDDLVAEAAAMATAAEADVKPEEVLITANV